MDPNLLDVVSPYCNPMGWHSRLANFRRFEDGMVAAGVRLTTVELAYGDRPFDLPDRDGVQRVRVRGRDVLWHKENLVNIGFAALPPDWRYGAMVDGDVLFHNPSWAAATVHQLQIHDVVQVATHLIWLGPIGEYMGAGTSFMHVYAAARKVLYRNRYYHPTNPLELDPGFPGHAWAYRRETWEAIGGLLDVCILGAADFHMVHALFDLPDLLLTDSDYKPSYRAVIAAWGVKARAAVQENVGSVAGLTFHLWHGSLAKRGYSTREQILIRNGFDPATDLVRDRQGLIGFAGNKPKLRADLAEYFASREEDGTG
jgi:hypothetical protein